MKAAKGFTLIELVIVITIIAILAALALPKFASLQTQARVAKAQALMGSMRAAAAIAKAGCLADIGTGSPGTCTSVGGSVTMEGVVVPMLNQYPTVAGIVLAAGLSAASDAVLVTTGATTTVDVNGGTSPNCRITYTAAPVNGSPTVAIVTTGC